MSTEEWQNQGECCSMFCQGLLCDVQFFLVRQYAVMKGTGTISEDSLRYSPSNLVDDSSYIILLS